MDAILSGCLLGSFAHTGQNQAEVAKVVGPSESVGQITSRNGGREGDLLYKPEGKKGGVRVTRGPWALALCLTTNLVIGQSSKSCTYTLSIAGHRNWAYFCFMGSGFRDNGWFAKLSYLGMKLASLANGQYPRSGTYTLFPPGGQNWAHSHSTDSGFWDTGRFSKLSYFGMNSRSCTYTLFLLHRV